MKDAGMVAISDFFECWKSAFAQIDGFTPPMEILYSPYAPENRAFGAFSGVVATSRFRRAGYHPFPQVRRFTPPARGIYSPQLAPTLVATFRLPAGYHPKPPNFRTWQHETAPDGLHGTRRTRITVEWE